MRTHPPPEERRGQAATQLGHRGSDKNRPSITDHWLEARLNFWSAECSRLGAGPIARRFLKEAKSRYQQYRRCGCPRLRYLAWSALAVVACQLVDLLTTSDNKGVEKCPRP
jgi:hypothetical protein